MGSLRSLFKSRWLAHHHKVTITEEPILSDNKIGVRGLLGPCEDGLVRPSIRTLIITNSQQDLGKQFLKICNELGFWELRGFSENSSHTHLFATKSDHVYQQYLTFDYTPEAKFSATYSVSAAVPGGLADTQTVLRADTIEDFDPALRHFLKQCQKHLDNA
jgi:hypothetical protein